MTVAKQTWQEEVDERLDELKFETAKQDGEEKIRDPKLADYLREESLAEYSEPFDSDKFERIMNTLELGDIVTFTFKAFTFWPVLCMQLIGQAGAGKASFEYVKDQKYPEEVFWAYVMTGKSYANHLEEDLVCRVVHVPFSPSHAMDFYTKYLTLALKDVTVQKPEQA